MAGKVEQSDLYMDFEEFIEEEQEGNNGDESEESDERQARMFITHEVKVIVASSITVKVRP